MSNYEKYASAFEEIRKYCKENSVAVVIATQIKRDSIHYRDIPRSENGILIVDHINLLRP